MFRCFTQGWYYHEEQNCSPLSELHKADKKKKTFVLFFSKLPNGTKQWTSFSGRLIFMYYKAGSPKCLCYLFSASAANTIPKEFRKTSLCEKRVYSLPPVFLIKIILCNMIPMMWLLIYYFGSCTVIVAFETHSWRGSLSGSLNNKLDLRK